MDEQQPSNSDSITKIESENKANRPRPVDNRGDCEYVTKSEENNMATERKAEVQRGLSLN